MIALDTLGFVGRGLNRPECVLAHSSGLLFAPCWNGNGGISIVKPDGGTRHLLAVDPPEPLRPNGIALEDGGSFLLAHLGAEHGAIFRLLPDGRVETVCDTVGGRPMPPANFVTTDRRGRIWFTVSTRKIPRSDDYRPSASSGFIARVDASQAHVVADGLGYTNEIGFSEDETSLWVNETFARRTSCFEVGAGGVLTGRKVAARYGEGVFPDGLALDSEGGLWVTSIVSNRVIRVAEDGSCETVVEDCDTGHLKDVEAAFQAGQMGRTHLDRAVSRRLKNISNLAFGGPDLRTAYLGCLLGDGIASFKAPVAGLAPVHWSVDPGPLVC